MNLSNIRNFAIISHIDHGKSTLADRFLEITNTVSKREMKEQFLDNMELEREKGITIKMRPVRMIWKPNHTEYILNLIDTPGHIDFSYEVSRALAATEGVILLVDAAQGIQAQTLTNIEIAKNLNLKIIPAVNKIDLKEARPKETKEDLVNLLSIDEDDILEISGKTGEGVPSLLNNVIEKIASPQAEFEGESPRALIFDFEYSEHKGIIAFVRVFDGILKKDQELSFLKSGVKFKAKEIGFLNPGFSPQDEIKTGEIGYIATGLKEPSLVRVGDTMVSVLKSLPGLSGYKEPRPVIWANFFPESQKDFYTLKKALLKLSLNDSAVTFEEIQSPSVGRGFKIGFLGMLHMEIIAERIKREFKINTINTIPNVSYLVKYKNGETEKIYSAANFPIPSTRDKIAEVKELWVDAEIILPENYLSEILKLLPEFEAEVKNIHNLSGNRLIIEVEMPLRELMAGFFDVLKSASSGYGSFNYDLNEKEEKWKVADVSRLDIIINDEEISALSRIVPSHKLNKEAESITEKLKNLLPRALYQIKIQARANGRIIAARQISALKKDVAGYLYGGDRTRKMKLWQKQKKGKEKLKEKSRYQIPSEVFLKVMK